MSFNINPFDSKFDIGSIEPYIPASAPAKTNEPDTSELAAQVLEKSDENAAVEIDEAEFVDDFDMNDNGDMFSQNFGASDDIDNKIDDMLQNSGAAAGLLNAHRDELSAKIKSSNNPDDELNTASDKLNEISKDLEEFAAVQMPDKNFNEPDNLASSDGSRSLIDKITNNFASIGINVTGEEIQSALLDGENTAGGMKDG